MFLLDTLLLLSPFAIYAYIRVRQQIGFRWAKWLWTSIAAFLALGYPLAETLSHSSVGSWAKPVMIVGYCTLPFMLYLVLTVLVSDCVVAILRLVRAVSRETTGTARFRKARLALWLVLPVSIVLIGLVNHQRLQIREFTIEIPHKSSPISLLRIVFVSDIHLSAITADNLLERLVSKINAAKPDIVLIGGDVLEGDRPDEDTREYEAQFRRIRSKYGVYGVLGNHDRRIAERTRFFENSGIRLLVDSVQLIDDAFYVAGRKDSRSEGRKSVDELLHDVPDQLPVILLAHRPADFETVSRSVADIQLSGHTHNGQVFPVNFVTKYLHPLSWGYLKKGRAHFFVSSGVQLWGPPVRTAGVAEIMAINVKIGNAPAAGC
ncbi:MAG TPA: metallophosphoesterase [Acidobacteriota bacterium]|mgnify:CR=1 FL=1|nr:metallophosphoesterase [Acidobacteriota bacterium]